MAELSFLSVYAQAELEAFVTGVIAVEFERRTTAAATAVSPYLTTIPLYGGLWMMACVSQTLDPRGLSAREVDRRISQRGLRDLRYYNGDMHRAALALPNFVRELVG